MGDDFDESVLDYWGKEKDFEKIRWVEPKRYQKEFEDKRFYTKDDAKALARMTSGKKADLKNYSL